MYNGLPVEECPLNARGKNVNFHYAELDLCSLCENDRRKLDAAHASDKLPKVQ